MPIEAPTLPAAAKTLQDHLNDLLTRTLTETRLIVFRVPNSSVVSVSFRQKGKPSSAELKTSRGRMSLELWQTCAGVPARRPGYVQLQTIRYRYALTVKDAEEPMLRWDYEKVRPAAKSWCRHHFQGCLPLPEPFGVALNELHVPTGYTLIEDVIRFCIDDLGVRARSPDWEDLLEESERKFKEEFALPMDRR